MKWIEEKQVIQILSKVFMDLLKLSQFSFIFYLEILDFIVF